MAKISFGGIVSDARNKLGDVVYSRNRGGAFAKARVTPYNPKSVSQQGNRGYMITVTNAWVNTLTINQRLIWNAYADANPYSRSKIEKGRRSGFGWFAAVNLPLVPLGYPIVTSPPANRSVYEPGGPPTFSISATGTTAPLTVPNPPFGQNWVKVQLTKPLSAGITRVYQPLRTSAYDPPGVGNPVDLWGQIHANFPAIAAGQHIGYRIRGINGINGMSGYPWYGILTVT